MNNNGVITNGDIGLNKYLVTTSSSEVTKGQNNNISTPATFTENFLIVENLAIAAGKTAVLQVALWPLQQHQVTRKVFVLFQQIVVGVQLTSAIQPQHQQHIIFSS